MAAFRERGFIGKDSLTVISGGGQILISGEISCLGNIVVKVEKALEITEGDGVDAYVQTVFYAYNASVCAFGNIFRHDNAEHYPEHADAHHRHDFDWRTDAQLELRWVGEDGWPTLGEFIEEVEQWYWAHRSELARPESYGELGLRK